MVHGDLGFLRFLRRRRIKAYSNKADNTRKIQTTRYRSTALSWVEIGARSLKGNEIQCENKQELIWVPNFTEKILI